MSGRRELFQQLMRRHETYVGLIIIAFGTAVTLVNPAFLTPGNIFDLLRSSSGTAILALGFFIALLTGGIEVSFPAIAISGQYIAVNAVMALGMNNLAVAFAISIAVGIVYGLFNAFFITTFNIPTLIVTLGTFNLFHGALLEFVGTHSVNTGPLPDAFEVFGKFRLFTVQSAKGGDYGLSIYVVILAAMIALTWFILRFTLLGRGIYAIGGDIEAARRAGFNVKGIQYFVYAYVGFLAGIMGIMHVSLIRYSNPNYIVDTELLRVIAAVVIGGTSITGGRGTVTGTILGVLMIVLLDKNLVMLGIPSFWNEFFVGLVIVGGVTANHLQARIRRGRRGGLIVERAH